LAVDNEELFEKLAREVAEWEYSSYYLEEEELFDLEGFLLDHHAHTLKEELEETYGRPLNEKFWSGSLAYQRLRRTREVVKEMDAEQERKRVEFAESLAENKKAREQLLRDLRASQRRGRLRVIPGGQSKSSKK
jgi:beta-phosphoglucomutase-like phosphatase (HAD superfamily)